jgi:hypothetical protein
MRWAGIPLIFGFSLLGRYLFNMSFKLEPVYILCCLLAVLNVFYTLHFSLLSRQMVLTKGMPGLKRFLGSYLTKFMLQIKSNGIKSLTQIPAVAVKILSIMYLMLLEALKDVPFNLLSLDNVMHSQVFGDLILITMLTRYTGMTESPLFFLNVVPITIAGAVLGFKTGIVYAAGTVALWMTISLLIKFQLLDHIKFYSPVYGDLSQCSGWIFSNSLVMLIGLSSSAFLAHRLTSIFKERIFYLNDLLYKSNTSALCSTHTSEQIPEGWIITDSEGNVEKIKLDRNGIFPSNLAGKNLLKVFPELEQYGMAYVMQSVVTGNSKKSLERIKITSKENTSHLFDCKISSFNNSENQKRLLILFEDRTEEFYLKDQLSKLKDEISSTKSKLDRINLESREQKNTLEDTLKTANERAIEIEVLNQKLKELESNKKSHENRISGLLSETAALKTMNDELSSELEYKQTVIEEVNEMVGLSSEIESLTRMIEGKARELFKLDNASLHIFQTHETDCRIHEVISDHQVSPRLLDIPRKNPDTLEPVINEGRPVLINARITPDKSATMAITSGPLQRLIAYVPVKHNNDTLGIMLLERFGDDSEPETMISTLSYFLKHCSAALKNAIESQSLKNKNGQLNYNIAHLHTQLDSIKAMVFNRPAEENHPFNKLLFEFGKITGVNDAILVRIHNDESIEIASRIDRSRSFELNEHENSMLEAIIVNPLNKAVLQLDNKNESLCGYPLMHGPRLLGILFVYENSETANELSETFTDFSLRLLRDQLALYVMNEEKELWESFYRETLSA